MDDIEKILEELKFEVGTSELLKNSKEKIVLGTGNFKGKILFVGDDSSLYEDENFKVKPSSSGAFLIKLCDIAGISAQDYYITTLTKSEEKYRELDEKQKKELKEYLDVQIALMNPKIIVALGEDVAKALLNNEIKFLNERGKVKEWIGSIKILMTYDANFAKKSRDNDGKKSQIALNFWEDLKTVKNIADES